MKKNIISVDDFYLKAKVNKNVCPLDWLAEFYRQHAGKLVMLDKNLLSYLLNASHCDEITETKFDGYQQKFTIVWKATKDYPETKIVVSSYGKDKIEKDEETYLVESDTNYYVIEELYAEDIIAKNTKYAQNLKDDKQIIFLVSPKLQNSANVNL